MAIKREKIHFESVDELLGAPVSKEEIIEIKIDLIYPFENHPFKVIDDDKMEELVESIKQNGVLSPVIVRPDDEGSYEMISGHRRMHASKLAGKTTIPAIVKKMTNDEAIIFMVDANVQREEILPSERAFSLKMKMDAMRHQGTCRHEVDKMDSRKTCSIVGESMGLGGRQVQRYVRLTELNENLLSLVDSKKIGITLAVEISYFDKEIQEWLYEYVKENGILKASQIEILKGTPNLENITQYTMIQILNDSISEKKKSGKVALSEKKLNKYFPPHFSAAQREKVILGLLQEWKEKKDLEK